MHIDVFSVIALIVAFVALFVALQLRQQLYSAAFEYRRRCSPQALGGWAGRTYRQFIFRELRYEVKFSTPIMNIDIDPRPDPYKRQGKGSKQYLLRRSKVAPEQRYDATDKPWFLRTEGTIPEAKCSWLTLLEDTSLTNVKVTITENRSFFDHLPTGVTRPIASADRKSFLTLMSLFGVKWKNKGKDDSHPAGEGDFCEITVHNLPYFGYVYRYDDRPRSKARHVSNEKYYLVSERARLAMFHHFDLGFATFRTHSDSALEESLEHPDALATDRDTANRVVAFYKGSREWCPGLSESITCWADESMPKVVDDRKDKFKSMFSAVSARSLTTGTPKFIAMLMGGESTHDRYRPRQTIPSVQHVTEWAKEYLTSFPDVKNKVFEWLKLAANWSAEDQRRDQNNIVDFDVSWTQSRGCLKGVQELDKHFDAHLLAHFNDQDRKRIKSAISNQQIKHGSRLFQDATDAATSNKSFWIDELDRVGADNYEKVVQHLTDYLHVQHPQARRIVVNRLMRGALWVVHNGNAPDQYKRVAECSLSSSCLEENSTVHIT